MLASQTMLLKTRIKKITNGWPIAMIIFGVALTLFWIILLVFLPLRLFNLV